VFYKHVFLAKEKPLPQDGFGNDVGKKAFALSPTL